MEITRLKHNKTFDEYFYEVPSRGKYHELGQIRGFPPVLFGCYINRDVKVGCMQKHLKEAGAILNYIGFTADEVKRSSRKQFASTPNRMYRFPLIEWGGETMNAYPIWILRDCRIHCRVYVQGVGCVLNNQWAH